MSKEKDFLKQKVFKDKKVEDILELIYDDAISTKTVLDDFIVNVITTIDGDSDKMVLFAKNVQGLLETNIKNTDNLTKMVDLVRRGTMTNNKDESVDEKGLGAELKRVLENVKKNKSDIATA